ILDLLLGIALLPPRAGPAGEGAGVRRVEFDRLGEVRDRLVVLALRVPSHAPVVEGDPVLRVEADGLGEVRDRLVVVTLQVPSLAAIRRGGVVRRVEAERIVVLQDGFLVVAPTLPTKPQAVVAPGGFSHVGRVIPPVRWGGCGGRGGPAATHPRNEARREE